ncbi:MAG: YitT family protein [Anaeroplasmataceae bacterium]|nr:YitT family protein [Anaeroplasmataceae bacterium]
MSKKKLYDDMFRAFIVIVCSTVYALSVVWFLEPANLISIGLTGLSQILHRLFLMAYIDIRICIFNLLINIPLCISGLKTMSPRFIFFSLLSVGVQAFWLMGWDWLKVDFGIPPTEKFFLSTIAGLICGFSIGVALRYGTSTGGVDIIAQALVFKKNISIGMFEMVINIILAIIAGGIMQHSWAITLYTFIFIIISNLVIDKVHTAYNFLRIDIISSHADEVAQALLEGIQRGCTMADVKGAYTKEQKVDVFMIISSYELQKAAEIIKKTDPAAFMTVSPIKRIFGKFFKHTII